MLLWKCTMQSRWVAWQETVIAMDLSCNYIFKFGDSLIGFALSVVYGTVITPSMKSKWDKNEDGNCKLCVNNRGTIQHILSGCPVSLQQGRYTWRHNKVIKQIYDQVLYHVEHRVNNPRRSTKNESKNIKFVGTGKNVVSSLKKKRNYGNMGIMTTAKDWNVVADLDKQLKFPPEVQVQCRPS